MARKSSNCHATHCRKLLERSGLNHVRSIPTLVNIPVNPIGYIYNASYCNVVVDVFILLSNYTHSCRFIEKYLPSESPIDVANHVQPLNYLSRWV